MLELVTASERGLLKRLDGHVENQLSRSELSRAFLSLTNRSHPLRKKSITFA
jgi:hypothetical protein